MSNSLQDSQFLRRESLEAITNDVHNIKTQN